MCRVSLEINRGTLWSICQNLFCLSRLRHVSVSFFLCRQREKPFSEGKRDTMKGHKKGDRRVVVAKP